MNFRIFSHVIRGTYVTIRVGFFGFGGWQNRIGTYKELKFGLFLLKFTKMGGQK